jgi:hypothetical protein
MVNGLCVWCLEHSAHRPQAVCAQKGPGLCVVIVLET